MRPQIPTPTTTAMIDSQRLVTKILAQIAAADGKLDFCNYMQMALYDPEFGYYIAGKQKFGTKGDFITAPEISPLFSQCLANNCITTLKELGQGDILEFGAGSGVMAAHILTHLSQQQCLPQHYYILDVSAELQQRQQQTLQQHCPELIEHVVWLTSLPKKFQGVILANEVLDAMPVHLFRYQKHSFKQRFVNAIDGQLAWHDAAVNNQRLQQHLAAIETFLTDEVVSEINLMLDPWLASLSDFLQRGLVLIIDYGYHRAEYYHPQRYTGTLQCHFQQYAHDDPLLYPGLQDITAHVDFTAVANSAQAHNLDLLGFTNQAAFLLSSGILQLDMNDFTVKQQFNLAQQIKKLTMPNEMGEIFKVMGLGRGIQNKVMGFNLQDMRSRL